MMLNRGVPEGFTATGTQTGVRADGHSSLFRQKHKHTGDLMAAGGGPLPGNQAYNNWDQRPWVTRCALRAAQSVADPIASPSTRSIACSTLLSPATQT